MGIKKLKLRIVKTFDCHVFDIIALPHQWHLLFESFSHHYQNEICVWPSVLFAQNMSKTCFEFIKKMFTFWISLECDKIFLNLCSFF